MISGFISRRIQFRGRMASVCVAVSFLVMIVAVAVSSGFRSEIRDGLSELCGDVTLTPLNQNYMGESEPIPSEPAFLPAVMELDCVKSVRGTIVRAGIVKEGDLIHGVLFKGVEDYRKNDSSALSVSVPSQLASMLKIGVGEDIATYFVGEKVIARKFRVESVYDGILSSEDKLIVYTDLQTMRRINGWKGNDVSALEVSLKEGCRSEESIRQAAIDIGAEVFAHSSGDEPTVIVSSVVQSYPQLFDWLNLIDFNVLVVLVLMTIVAGFNMISGLLILLFENVPTIGLLKALGMKDRGIAAIFLRSSAVLVGKGMAVGNVAALGLCLIQKYTRLLKLSPENYFVSFVPIHIDWLQILAADALSFADSPFSAISDGQRQRILLARAICQQPRVLVLDEPTSFLDIRYKLELLTILKKLVREQNVAVVLSLHELDLAQKISDRVVCVKNGEITCIGTPEEVFAKGSVRELYGLTAGSYDERFGSLELEPVRGEPQALVVGGGGSGIALYRALQRQAVPFAAGVLHENDMDCPVASALACEVVSEQPYQPISDAAFSRAQAIMRRCRRVYAPLRAFGPMNEKNRELIAEAETNGWLCR